VQKQKAAVGKGEVKGRTALNNISNNVENVNRPITRFI
jgi:prephenate dehydratase